MIGSSTFGPGAVVIPATGSATAEAACVGGGQAIGGSFTSTGGQLHLVASQLKPATTDTWELTFFNSGAGPITVTPTVTCIGDVADS